MPWNMKKNIYNRSYNKKQKKHVHKKSLFFPQSKWIHKSTMQGSSTVSSRFSTRKTKHNTAFPPTNQSYSGFHISTTFPHELLPSRLWKILCEEEEAWHKEFSSTLNHAARISSAKRTPWDLCWCSRDKIFHFTPYQPDHPSELLLLKKNKERGKKKRKKKRPRRSATVHRWWIFNMLG